MIALARIAQLSSSLVALRIVFQATGPDSFLGQLPGLGVGGLLAVGFFLMYRAAVESKFTRELELQKELADTKLSAAEKIAKIELEARNTIVATFNRAVDVQEKGHEFQRAMTTALNEVASAMREVASAQRLEDRIDKLEGKLSAAARQTT